MFALSLNSLRLFHLNTFCSLSHPMEGKLSNFFALQAQQFRKHRQRHAAPLSGGCSFATSASAMANAADCTP